PVVETTVVTTPLVETTIVETTTVDTPVAEKPAVETTVVATTTVETTVVETTVVETSKAEVQQDLPFDEPQVAEQEVETAVEKPKRVISRKPSPKVSSKAGKVSSKGSKPGKSSAPMTKTESITTMNEVPTDFIASEDRVKHASSGKMARVSNAVSRSGAGPTKP
ncbi:hypothetical protein H4J75_12740, partial [Colwellia sp. BRX10-1]|nr:hypothetical protein [Colwellia sp. BRX10-1]